MSDCCSLEKNESKLSVSNCLNCNNPGKPVKLKTVSNFIIEPKQDLIADKSYLFCNTLDCNIVYFSSDKKSMFTLDDIKGKIGQKMSGSDAPVCYCFNFSRGDIEREIKEKGSANIPEYIKDKIKTKKFECEIKNP